MTAVNKIACPVCNTNLVYDVYGLLAGQSYRCPNCSAVLSLANESQGVLADTMEKYEALKQTGGRQNET